jgi:hypothetical protein
MLRLLHRREVAGAGLATMEPHVMFTLQALRDSVQLSAIQHNTQSAATYLRELSASQPSRYQAMMAVVDDPDLPKVRHAVSMLFGGLNLDTLRRLTDWLQYEFGFELRRAWATESPELLRLLTNLPPIPQAAATNDGAPPPALLSAADLARLTGQSVDKVESFLRRYRRDYPDCYVESESKRKTEPKYLYRTADVLPALQSRAKSPPVTDE